MSPDRRGNPFYNSKVIKTLNYKKIVVKSGKMNNKTEQALSF